MNYINRVLTALRPLLQAETDRYNQAHGTDYELDERLVQMYALLVFVRGADTTLEDVHDAWALVRNIDRPDHKALVPFDQLSDDVAEFDEPYRDAIVAVAEGVRLGL